MPVSRLQSKPKSWLWRTLTSIRLTVFLLLILAALAVIGTVLPQNQPPGQYLARFGEVWGGLLWRAGFADVYFSPWFLAPLCLLALNILACVVHGLPQAVRRARTRLTGEAALGLPERGRISWGAQDDPHPLITAALGRELGRCQQESRPDKEIYYGERGRLRPLGPYLIHLGLLLILAGGLIGKFWGVDGQLPIGQGEVADSFRVGSQVLPLDYQVRLDKFQVMYYEGGSTPKEFRSDLTFLKDGREVSRATCRVNEPVSFGGFTFYQSSYGAQAAGPIRLQVTLADLKQTIELPFRQMVELPGGHGRIIAMRVDGNFQGLGPAVLLAFNRSGHPQAFWALQDHPELGEQPGPHHFTVKAIPLGYYSVFQVKHDPGVGWVYAGFLLFLPGFYLAFFRPAERWALVLEKSPQGKWKGRLLGASPRHREEFAARQERLLSALKRGTPS